MKSILGFLLGLIVLTSAMKLPGPPRGNDLNDHFGSNPSANKYGPISPVLKPGQLMRVGLHSGIPITPMTNFNQEINPKDVVAGDLLNTAPDALKIIKPHMAAPKAKIDTTFRHEAIVKTPVHLGNNIEEKSVKTMDRLTGKISKRSIRSTKPILGILNTVREVETPHTTVFDLKTHQVIDTDTKKKVNVGI